MYRTEFKYLSQEKIYCVLESGKPSYLYLTGVKCRAIIEVSKTSVMGKAHNSKKHDSNASSKFAVEFVRAVCATDDVLLWLCYPKI